MPDTQIQPYAPESTYAEHWAGLPITDELRDYARAARDEARKPGSQRRYQIHWVPLRVLTGADYNPRIMPDEDAENLASSMQTYGQVEPLVVNTFAGREGVIVGGHQRLNAAINLRWDSIGVVWVYLTPQEERAANLALNRIHGLWDEHKLAAVIHDLTSDPAYDPATLIHGFSTEEVEDLLALYGQDTADGLGDDEDDEDVPPLDSIVPRCATGELWQLPGAPGFGDHLLLVGDARSPEDVSRLFGLERATCLWTDPPYGVNYVGKTREALTIDNDGAFDLDDLLVRAFAAADEHALSPGAALYVCEPCGVQSLTFRVRFVGAGWRFHETLVWVKDSMVLGHSDYHVRHETILYGYKPGIEGEGRYGRGGSGWFADDSQTTVFEVPRPKASREHPTMKPIALVAAMLANSCAPRGLVYDPFLGSGTTLLAADRLERRCFGIELSARYATVALNRFEEQTGRTAVRLETRSPIYPTVKVSRSPTIVVDVDVDDREIVPVSHLTQD